jgi:GT2 family glycosyltransferase/glycosyltransferase involved in cell wall biosynthesis
MMPEEYRGKFASAIKSITPDYIPAQLADANQRLYKNVERMLTTNPGSVDVILPVYNSIHIVEECIISVIKHTIWPYKLIIVDDASDKVTNAILKEYAKKYDHIELITNAKNRGFSATVNRGIKAGTSPYVCLLNSDVLVTPRWLTKMVLALEDNKRNQIVNPVTNNTAEIAVPMPQGVSYIKMNEVLEKYSQCKYPEIMPTGFCYMFRRDWVDKIGYMDEGYPNFGEETDYWMKILTKIENSKYPRYRAVLADDTYVFHERGSSFTNLGADKHWELRKTAANRFNSLDSKYSICWVTHSTAFCGGMKFISDIVNSMNDRGIDARVALIKRNPETPDNQVEILGQLRTAPIMFNTREDFVKNFTRRVFSRGIVVASTSELAPAVAELCEPYLTDDPKLQETSIKSFQSIEDVISSSKWVSRELKSIGVRPFATVKPGVDVRLFYPRSRDKGDERKTLMVPMLKSYGFKGYNRGVELINEVYRLAEENNKEIRILVYGQDTIHDAPMATGLGAISQPRLATLLGTEVDLLVDPALVHSYGMPALEAIASGVPIVSWDNLGVREYVEKGNIVPNNVPPKMFARLVYGVLVGEIPIHLKVKISEHRRETQVDKLIGAIEQKYSLNRKKRDILMVTPHLRKHGGPTTIIATANQLAKKGHNVSIFTVYPDINPEVVEGTDLPIIVNNGAVPSCDLLVSNSDNPMNKQFVDATPQAKKKIMLKLSHNARFKQLENDSLCLDWDAIVTSTQWLVDVCTKPLDDWSHPPKMAGRVGWFHYGHKRFHSPPAQRAFGDGKGNPIRIATLIHQHPLKGSKEAMAVLQEVAKTYGNKVMGIGVGEVDRNNFKRPPWMTYVYRPNREQMAKLLAQVDVWVGASHTEGLGRMALEAMSAGCACVLTNTGAEFLFHEKNCLLFEPGDLQKAYDHIKAIIEDPTLANQLRMNGYKTAEVAADPTEYTDNLERVIDQVCHDI